MKITRKGLFTVGPEAVVGNVLGIPHGLPSTPTSFDNVKPRSIGALGVDAEGNPGGAFYVSGADAENVYLTYTNEPSGGTFKCKFSCGDSETAE